MANVIKNMDKLEFGYYNLMEATSHDLVFRMSEASQKN